MEKDIHSCRKWFKGIHYGLNATEVEEIEIAGCRDKSKENDDDHFVLEENYA